MATQFGINASCGGRNLRCKKRLVSQAMDGQNWKHTSTAQTHDTSPDIYRLSYTASVECPGLSTQTSSRQVVLWRYYRGTSGRKREGSLGRFSTSQSQQWSWSGPDAGSRWEAWSCTGPSAPDQRQQTGSSARLRIKEALRTFQVPCS